MSVLMQFDQLLSDESVKCNHVGGGLSRMSLSMKDYFKMQSGDLEKRDRRILSAKQEFSRIRSQWGGTIRKLPQNDYGSFFDLSNEKD
jgi:hypothetical protein